MIMLALLFKLLAGHALADFSSLQSDLMANAKNRFKPHPIHPHVPWFYWLASHALIHGGIVYVITGSVLLGLAETICHAVIDYLKCHGTIGIHKDQALHIACKAAWAVCLLG